MSYQKEITLNNFRELIHSKFGSELDSIHKLKADASERKIFRLFTNENSLVGIYNENVKENLAFINFTESFIKLGLNVPRIIAVSDDNLYYIEEDLGDTTLFSISKNSDKSALGNYHKNALADLVRFQVEARNRINYSYCYQTKLFNAEVVMNDLKQFNQYFNKSFLNDRLPEDVISNIFLDLSSEVAKARNDFFLYRDFQPRNIMLHDDQLYYIDYQSGRKGPLQYDVASFLYTGSIDLNDEERLSLIDFYVKELNKYISYDAVEFRYHFYHFAFARIIQVLGSYGYQYATRKDEGMLKKISKAINNLKSLEDKINDREIRNFTRRIVE